MPLLKTNLIAILSCISLSSYADKVDTLMNMSFDELLNISVTVASQRSESIISAPGIVSRYNTDELASFGVDRFIDVLRFIPGVIVEETNSGNTIVQIRGLSDGGNQKVLFIVNDIPYWMAATGNSPLWGIPLAAISHVEVIRGPGALKYGTNASAGVIKVVTKDSQTDTVTLKLGENSLANLSAYYSTQLTEDTDINVGFELQSYDGFDAVMRNANQLNPVTFQFEPTANGVVNLGTENRALYVDIVDPQWKLTGQLYESEEYANTTGSIVEVGTSKRMGSLVAAEYQVKTDSGDVRFFGEYNHFYREFVVDNILAIANLPGSAGGFIFREDGEDNFRIRGALHGTFNLSDSLELLVGVETEQRRTSELVFSDSNGGADIALISPVPLPPGQDSILIYPEGKVLEHSAILQLDYSFNQFRLLGGLRYVDNDTFGGELMPRLAMVYEINERSSVKLLHSQAYNSPVFRQLQVVDGLGNPIESDLDAEIIATTDLAYNYYYNNFLFVINAYHTTAEDLIVTRQQAFLNDTNVLRRTGVELDLQYQSDKSLYYVNAAWLKEGGELKSVDSLASVYPELFVSFGMRETLKNHQLGLAAELYSARETTGSGHRVTFNWRYTQYDVQPFITVKNVFDQVNLSPDLRTNNQFLIQAYDKRNVLIGIRTEFD